MEKMHKDRVPKVKTTPTTRPLQLIHSDLCGPLPTTSKTGNRYILTFIDDYTRKTWLYFLAMKSQTLALFKQFKTLVETPLHRIQTLRSDRGGEYLSAEFSSYCSTQGIHRQLTTAYSSHQNGLAERKNMTILEGIRSVVAGTKIPRYLWEEIAKAVNYIQNRCPTKAIKLKTPEEMYTGIRPNISHFRVLGCVAYCHIPDAKRTKLEPKAVTTILVGYDESSKAYRCYNPATRKILISCDVRFDERSCDPNITQVTEPLIDATLYSSSATKLTNNMLPNSETQPLPDFLLPDLAPADPFPQASIPQVPSSTLPRPAPRSTSSPAVIPPQAPRRSQRPRYQNVRLDGYDLFVSTDDFDICMLSQDTSFDPDNPSSNSPDPDLHSDAVTFEQACRDPGWRAAMSLEIGSIHSNNTWTLAKLPLGHKAITCRWVFKVKEGLDNGPPIKKARLVARGFQQKEGIDFIETFAPVIKWATIRTAVALAVAQRWRIHHMDVHIAFLYGHLKEIVYMRQPPGFISQGQENLVCKLHKSLYGLKQSPRAWYERIDTELRKIGMK
jgi:hypothetical protein